MRNSIFIIKPYKWEGMWVFDDPTVGLVREAFVAGADELLDKVAGGDSCIAVFSCNKFPTWEYTLDLVNTSPEGSNYYCCELMQPLWLCPALYLYYPVAPKTIYLQIK